MLPTTLPHDGHATASVYYTDRYPSFERVLQHIENAVAGTDAASALSIGLRGLGGLQLQRHAGFGRTVVGRGKYTAVLTSVLLGRRKTSSRERDDDQG